MATSVQMLARELNALKRQMAGLSGGPQLAHTSLEDGAVLEYDGMGTLVSSWGKQFDGTHAQVTLGGPPPPAPVPPGVTPGPLSLTVRWSGRFAGDALSPMDFQQVEVHVSTDPGFDASTTSTLRATIRGELGDEVVISPLQAIPHYVRLVARSLSGKSSIPSEVVEATPDDLASSTADGKITVEARPPALADAEGKPLNALWNELDGSGTQVAVWRWDGNAWMNVPISETMLPLVNIAQGTYGKLQGVQLEANAIDGMRITGAIIQTSTAPNRGVKFTDAGIAAYNTVGTQTFDLSSATGDVSFLGRIRAGSTIEGATITGSTVSAGGSGVTVTLGVDSMYGGSLKFATTQSALPGSLTALSIDMIDHELTLRSPAPTEAAQGIMSIGSALAGGNPILATNANIELVPNKSIAWISSPASIYEKAGNTFWMEAQKELLLESMTEAVFITAAKDIWLQSGTKIYANGRDISTNTGNINCTIKPGFTMQGGRPPTARKDGNRTYLNWGINGAGFTASAGSIFATLPPGFAPTDWKYFPITSNSVAAAGMLIVRSNGDLELRTSGTVGTYYIFDAVSWFTDS
ncbi:hypothetical protein ACSYDW_01380 [Paeniglutamicibacter sp. R2-26]|uniref:hypothetical protein n=1 Tax=Paeniglutamicibacter sp. R2-26 TaxID=3144417 RepID=UPI003EE64500